MFYGIYRILEKWYHVSKMTFAFHKAFLSLGLPKNTPESKHHNVKLALGARVIPHLYLHSQRAQTVDLKNDFLM